MYILCGYYQSFEELPPVKIIGIYETLDEAIDVQEAKCGRIKRINNCWYGRNNIITWIYEANLGTLDKALDIRYTGNALSDT